MHLLHTSNDAVSGIDKFRLEGFGDYMYSCFVGHEQVCRRVRVYVVRKHATIQAYKVTKKNPYIQIYGEKSEKKVKIVWKWWEIRGANDKIEVNNAYGYVKSTIIKN